MFCETIKSPPADIWVRVIVFGDAVESSSCEPCFFVFLFCLGGADVCGDCAIFIESLFEEKNKQKNKQGDIKTAWKPT